MQPHKQNKETESSSVDIVLTAEAKPSSVLLSPLVAIDPNAIPKDRLEWLHRKLSSHSSQEECLLLWMAAQTGSSIASVLYRFPGEIRGCGQDVVDKITQIPNIKITPSFGPWSEGREGDRLVTIEAGRDLPPCPPPEIVSRTAATKRQQCCVRGHKGPASLFSRLADTWGCGPLSSRAPRSMMLQQRQRQHQHQPAWTRLPPPSPPPFPPSPPPFPPSPLPFTSTQSPSKSYNTNDVHLCPLGLVWCSPAWCHSLLKAKSTKNCN